MSVRAKLIPFNLTLINFDNWQRKKIKVQAKDQADAFEKAEHVCPGWAVELVNGHYTGFCPSQKYHREKKLEKWNRNNDRRSKFRLDERNDWE